MTQVSLRQPVLFLHFGVWRAFGVMCKQTCVRRSRAVFGRLTMGWTECFERSHQLDGREVVCRPCFRASDCATDQFLSLRLSHKLERRSKDLKELLTKRNFLALVA